MFRYTDRLRRRPPYFPLKGVVKITLRPYPLFVDPYAVSGRSAEAARN